jgi:phosphatidate phosphatase APP1
MDWQRWVARTATRIEKQVDRGKVRLSRKLRPNRAVRVVPYRGFGGPAGVRVRGRILYGSPPRPSSPEDRWWQNLANAYRRLESDEVPGARVRVRFLGAETEVVADDEGHFHASLPAGAALSAGGYWHEAEIELVDPPGRGARAPIAVPRDPTFGVISDLDDTVLQTGVRKVIRMALEVLFGNAHSRIPFPGVGAFYRALHTGTNPIFYVSSSPWNLYDVLSQFLELHRIPAGPMELRDWGLSADEILPTRHGAHKRESIESILRAFPTLSFLLVGDSGQADPEIYRDIVHDHPDRILGIYIRNVSPEPARRDAVHLLAEEVAAHDVDLVLADDTLTAARHAARRGWIESDDIDAVARDRAREETDFPG